MHQLRHHDRSTDRAHDRHASAAVEACQAIAIAAAAPAQAPVNGIVWRRVRVWPTPESVDWMGEVGPGSMSSRGSWLDSSLDLRDGLSVIELHPEPAAADEADTEFGALH